MFPLTVVIEVAADAAVVGTTVAGVTTVKSPHIDDELLDEATDGEEGGVYPAAGT